MDVRVTNPSAKSNARAALKILGASLEAERAKKRKHKKNAEKVGAVFVPYVVETYGGVTPEAQTFNHILAKYAEDLSTTETKDEFTQKLESEIAVAIQQGNYKMITNAAQQTAKAVLHRQKSLGYDDYIAAINHRKDQEVNPGKVGEDFIFPDLKNHSKHGSISPASIEDQVHSLSPPKERTETVLSEKWNALTGENLSPQSILTISPPESFGSFWGSEDTNTEMESPILAKSRHCLESPRQANSLPYPPVTDAADKQEIPNPTKVLMTPGSEVLKTYECTSPTGTLEKKPPDISFSEIKKLPATTPSMVNICNEILNDNKLIRSFEGTNENHQEMGGHRANVKMTCQTKKIVESNNKDNSAEIKTNKILNNTIENKDDTVIKITRKEEIPGYNWLLSKDQITPQTLGEKKRLECSRKHLGENDTKN